MPPAGPPVVVTLDVDSSSVRALGFDARGRALPVERQSEYEPRRTPDGGVEMDADGLLRLTAETLDGLLRDLGPGAGDVAGVAVCTFWHTLPGGRRDHPSPPFPGPLSSSSTSVP